MFYLLRNMIKEEWRLHTTLMGNLNFMLLPLLMLFFGALAGFFGSIFKEVFTVETLVAIPHVSFLFFGMTVGGFGISGQEFMNRRFGQISLLSYSSRSLPIPERKIFMATVIKDIIYYFAIWILPLVLGFFAFESIMSHSTFYIFIVSLSSLSISFMLGLSSTFFLSSLYANSFLSFMLVSIAVAVFTAISYNLRIFFATLLVPLSAIQDGNLLSIAYMLILITFFILFSLIFVRFDFKHNLVTYHNQYPKISDFFSFTRYRVFLSKDYLDLKRSRGGIGKIIFSYLVPLVFIYYFVEFFRTNVIDTSFVVMFSILLGVFSASIYTWITEHDLFSQYMFLPVRKSDLMRSKIMTFFALNLVSYFVIMTFSLLMSEMNYLLLSLIIFSVVSLYSLSLTIYLTGLLPSVRFMNAKILLVYMLSIVPVMLSLILIYEFFLALTFPILLIIALVSLVLLKQSFPRWDDADEQTF